MTSRPVAVRAAAFTAPSRWSKRPMRSVRYDALWPNGRIDFDISLVDTMYRGAPADYSPVAQAVNDRCPEVGAGPWIDELGFEVEGPSLPAGRAGGGTEGSRQRFRPVKGRPQRPHRAVWQVIARFALLSAGTAGLTATGNEGPVAFVWFLPTISGLALLGSRIGRRKPW